MNKMYSTSHDNKRQQDEIASVAAGLNKTQEAVKIALAEKKRQEVEIESAQERVADKLKDFVVLEGLMELEKAAKEAQEVRAQAGKNLNEELYRRSAAGSKPSAIQIAFKSRLDYAISANVGRVELEDGKVVRVEKVANTDSYNVYDAEQPANAAEGPLFNVSVAEDSLDINFGDFSELDNGLANDVNESQSEDKKEPIFEEVFDEEPVEFLSAVSRPAPAVIKNEQSQLNQSMALTPKLNPSSQQVKRVEKDENFDKACTYGLSFLDGETFFGFIVKKVNLNLFSRNLTQARVDKAMASICSSRIVLEGNNVIINVNVLVLNDPAFLAAPVQKPLNNQAKIQHAAESYYSSSPSLKKS